MLQQYLGHNQSEPTESYLEQSIDDNLQTLILSFLAPQEICTMSLLSHKWKGLTENNQLWKELYHQHHKEDARSLSDDLQTNYKQKFKEAKIKKIIETGITSLSLAISANGYKHFAIDSLGYKNVQYYGKDWVLIKAHAGLLMSPIPTQWFAFPRKEFDKLALKSNPFDITNFPNIRTFTEELNLEKKSDQEKTLQFVDILENEDPNTSRFVFKDIPDEKCNEIKYLLIRESRQGNGVLTMSFKGLDGVWQNIRLEGTNGHLTPTDKFCIQKYIKSGFIFIKPKLGQHSRNDLDSTSKEYIQELRSINTLGFKY